jgi:hypothetical protein
MVALNKDTEETTTVLLHTWCLFKLGGAREGGGGQRGAEPSSVPLTLFDFVCACVVVRGVFVCERVCLSVRSLTRCTCWFRHLSGIKSENHTVWVLFTVSFELTNRTINIIYFIQIFVLF